MHQRWTYRCYPTPTQEEILARTFGCVRYVYNWALEERTRAYKEGRRLSYVQTSAALTLLKREPDKLWLAEVNSQVLQQSLRNLQTAFSNFFAKRSGYPSFKKKTDTASACYVRGCFSLRDGKLKLGRTGELRVSWSRNLPVAPSSLTIKKHPSGRYYVSFVVDVLMVPKPRTNRSVGVDFGLSRLAVLSTGECVSNPRHSNKRQKRLAFLQKNLARKQKGSWRRKAAKRAVAREYEKIANARKDVLHKLTTRLVTEFDAIYIEDLHLRGMVKNHNLARSLSDASIGAAMRMLEYKAEWYGKKVVKIDRFFPSSKLCSGCGHVIENMPLSVRAWKCPRCAAIHDRDINAAKNILAVGQTVSAHGDGVRAA